MAGGAGQRGGKAPAQVAKCQCVCLHLGRRAGPAQAPDSRRSSTHTLGFSRRAATHVACGGIAEYSALGNAAPSRRLAMDGSAWV